MTLFADASYDSRSRAAGWGSWAIRDGWERGRFQGGRIELRDAPVDGSNIAELAALALALWKHRAQGDLDGLESIMLQSDSVTALSLIRNKIPGAVVVMTGGVRVGGKASSRHPSAPIILDTIKMLVGDCRLLLKHVKGHTAKTDGRSWVNRHCDSEARRHMIAMRKELTCPSPSS